MSRDGTGVVSAPASDSPPQPPTVESTKLFGAGREIVIVHKGERYRLRVTQSDKLILTK